MSTATTTPAAAPVVAARIMPADVKRVLELETKFGERLEVKPLWGDYFRVNWLVADLRPGSLSTLKTFRRSRSLFCRAVRTADGLTLIRSERQ